MSGDRHDLTGQWHGTFSYPAFAGPTTPFVCNLIDAGGRFTGTTLEPNATGDPGEPEELEADVIGTREDRAVDFTKTYGGTMWNHSVDYVGQVSEDGGTITGVWSVDQLDGTFEMHRDTSLAEVLADEAEAEEVPAGQVEPVEDRFLGPID